MKHALVVLVVVLLAGMAAAAEPTKQVMIETRFLEVNNAFFELSAGMARPVGQDATWTGDVGFNHGLPLVEDWGLGFQWGGKATLRDDEPDYLAGIGVFQRGLNVDSMQGMWGLQGFWQNTHDKVDLAYVKPTLGLQLNDRHCFSLTGMWGKNEDRAKFRIPWLHKQEGINQADAVWGMRHSDKLSTELIAGYQFGGVDRLRLGGSLAWRLDDAYSLVMGGSGNFKGNYAASIGLCLDLGANSRTDRLIKVRQDDPDDYTPLPLDGPTGPRFRDFKIFK